MLIYIIQNPDFTLKDVAKKCLVDKNSVINVVNSMASNKEIYAEYFYVTKKFAFNKKANIEEIDHLMSNYQEWEKNQLGKT